jgi:hypothetical protein
MKTEIIYTKDYALIVSDEQAKESDWGYIPFQGGDVKLVGKYFADDWKKVIGHRPLTDAPILEGLNLLPEFSHEEDVEDLALAYASSKGNINPGGYSDKQVGLLHGFIDGYDKAKETYKYTEEDLIKAIQMARGIKDSESEFEIEDISGLTEICTYGWKEKYTDNEIIQSIQQPKRPKYFEYEIKFFHDETIPYPKSLGTKPKTTTNPQGQIELVGEYTF